MQIRPFRPEDLPQVLSILERSLGWLPDDDHERFFHWKHEENPFGPSRAWVADDAGTVAGFRTFMRWEFTHESRVVLAVRAVDTATNPEYRGRGVFRDLTMHALDAVREEGIEFVFNTPNDQSRPGYLKMGWQVVGRVPLHVRPSGLAGMVRLARSRQAADLWSQPCGHGVDAASALADAPSIDRLLRAYPTGAGLATHRTPEYLAWRYAFPSLRYRAVLAGDTPAGGLAIFRVRRRGQALEAAVAEILVPAGDSTLARQMVTDVVSGSGADYGVVLGSAARVAGLVPLPGHGPVLTWRALVPTASLPPLRAWRLALGDVELF